MIRPGPGAAGFAEFVVLTALMISLVALAIDAMLPALPEIAGDLGVTRINDSQYVITIFFIGMGLGQILFGPMSDIVGRRPAIICGLLLFACGCLLSVIAANYDQMLVGRMLAGIGAAGPRIVSIALVRDRFKGREMARVMSFIMTVFILVPVFAPALGQVVLMVAGWQVIFVIFLLLALVIGSWFWLRQPETLAPENRVRFSLLQIIVDIRGILRIRAALGYTLTMGLVFGAFIGYLGSSQQILQLQYRLFEWFPLYFGILACAIGCASLLNARLVMRFGMRRLSRYALVAVSLLSFPFWLLAWSFDGQPQLYLLMAYLLILFFCFGILFGNLNAMAMEPLGHIAGLGASVIGSISMLISVLIGILIGNAYDETVLPLVGGFAVCGLLALLVLHWTEARLAPQG